MRSCLRRRLFRKHDSLFHKSRASLCVAASGGDFSRKMSPFALRSRASLCVAASGGDFSEIGHFCAESRVRRLFRNWALLCGVRSLAIFQKLGTAVWSPEFGDFSEIWHFCVESRVRRFFRNWALLFKKNILNAPRSNKSRQNSDSILV